MAIESIAAASIQNLLQNSQSTGTSASDGSEMFKDIFNGLISNANQTDAVFQADTIKSAQGELDNPHQLLIDSEKAEVALQLTINVVNKAIGAYNDIIKMSV